MISLQPAGSASAPDLTATLRRLLGFYSSSGSFSDYDGERFDLGSSQFVPQIQLGDDYRVSIARLLGEDQGFTRTLVLLDRRYLDNHGEGRWRLAGVAQADTSLTSAKRSWRGQRELFVHTERVASLAARLHARLLQRRADLEGEVLIRAAGGEADADGWPLGWQRVVPFSDQTHLAITLDKAGHAYEVIDPHLPGLRVPLSEAYLIGPEALDRRITRLAGEIHQEQALQAQLLARPDALDSAGVALLSQTSEVVEELETLVGVRDELAKAPIDATLAPAR